MPALLLSLFSATGLKVMAVIGGLVLLGSGALYVEHLHSRAVTAEADLATQKLATANAVATANANAALVDQVRAEAATAEAEQAALSTKLAATAADLATLKEQADASPTAKNPVDLGLGTFLGGLRQRNGAGGLGAGGQAADPSQPINLYPGADLPGPVRH